MIPSTGENAPLFSFTVAEDALATTWWLVTIRPSGDTRNPLPSRTGFPLASFTTIRTTASLLDLTNWLMSPEDCWPSALGANNVVRKKTKNIARETTTLHMIYLHRCK